jgi:hypothetical protein
MDAYSLQALTPLARDTIRARAHGIAPSIQTQEVRALRAW